MNRELSEGNIECLRFFEFKSPAILYDDSLSYKESSLQDSSLKFNDKCELSLPNTKNKLKFSIDCCLEKHYL